MPIRQTIYIFFSNYMTNIPNFQSGFL